MAQDLSPPPSVLGASRWAAPIAAVIGVIIAGVVVIGYGKPHPHAFDLALLLRQPPVILGHLGAALLAVGLGAVQFLAPKGTLPHRALGWIWVILMMTVAGSSIFIRVINHGGFSLIHGLSAYVLLVTPLGVLAARRHNVTAHSRTMTGLFTLGLIVAGAFTFVPGRLMWSLFLG